MSTFKKMYLLSEDKLKTNVSNKNENPYNLFMSPYLKSVSELDSDMKQIIESDIDVNEKVKLYTNALQRYLLHRYKYLEPKDDDRELADILSTKIVKPIKRSKIKKKYIKSKKRVKIIKSSPKFSEIVTPLATPIASTSKTLTKKTTIKKQKAPISEEQNLIQLTSPKKIKRLANIKAKSRIKTIAQDEESSPKWDKL